MVLIEESEVCRFITDCMSTKGVSVSVGSRVANLLVSADKKGCKSHGLNRVERYIAEIESGFCSGVAEPEVIKDGPSTAWVDGKSCLGVVSGEFCMSLAISKAKSTGVAVVSAKRTNHFGMAGFYSEMAAKEGLIGMAFMVPTRAMIPAIGSNPISFAAPGTEGQNLFSLDMATTCVAAGKLEMKRRRKEELPTGWAVDKEGNPTTDAEVAVLGQPKLMPLGGPEESSGYKGFGLGCMVEILCGVLSGSKFGPTLGQWRPSKRDVLPSAENDYGATFIAIDPGRFSPGFGERNQDFMDFVRGLEPRDPEKPVKIPGDIESSNVRFCSSRTGGKSTVIEYHEREFESTRTLAEKLGVRPMETYREWSKTHAILH